MDIRLLLFYLFLLKINHVTSQYGLQIQFPLNNYQRYGTFNDNGYNNRPYLDNYGDNYGGYGPYNGANGYGGSYPSNNYINSNYGGVNPNQNLGGIVFIFDVISINSYFDL